MSHRSEFEKFDRNNPKIWELFQRFCEQVLRAGRTKSGARMILERIRWETFITTKSDDDYKINDHHTPYYARKWLALHPEHPDFFETRRIKGEEGHWDDDGQGNFFL